MKRKYSRNRWSHRRLQATPHFENPQKGDDVRALQRAYNALPVSVRGSDYKLKVDGQFGRGTLGRVRHAARALGIGLHGPGVSVYVQHLIRHPKQRTPAQKKRGAHFRHEHPPVRKIKVDGNKVTGGENTRDRVVEGAMEAAHLYYSGEAHRFYSQPGTWTVDYGITGEPSGYRSDCSQFVTSIYHSAGAKDPNGNSYRGGYTGTLGGHGRYISRDQLKPGDLVLYGPAPHHHVEMYVGPGDRTVGHGSPPVDYGDIDMIADPHFATYDL